MEIKKLLTVTYGQKSMCIEFEANTFSALLSELRCHFSDLDENDIKFFDKQNVILSPDEDSFIWKIDSIVLSPRLSNHKNEGEQPEVQEWSNLLVQLQEYGFSCLSKNLQLLRLYNGDLGKVIDELIAEDEMKILEKTAPKGIKRRKSWHQYRKNKRSNQEKFFRNVANSSFVQDLWPENITHLFVDGNNMFYLTTGLRFLSLRRSTRETERVLAEITESFSKVLLLETVLIFDNSKFQSSKVLENGSKLTIKSARPNFPTSDAALINWAKNNPEIAPRTLVVTSDKALTGELALSGVKITKCGIWMNFVKLTLTGQPGNYCSWVDGLVDNLLK